MEKLIATIIGAACFAAILAVAGCPQSQTDDDSYETSCSADYPLDCGDGICCPAGEPYLCSGYCNSDSSACPGAYVTCIDETTCPAEYPLDCGGGNCCPAGMPYLCDGECNSDPSACPGAYVTCVGGGTADPVDAIVNGDTAATAATHWNCAGSYTGCGNIAFYADGSYESLCNETNCTLVTGTWTKVGPASLVMDPGFIEGTSLSSISGSVENGSFTANTATGAALYFGIESGGV